MKTLKESILGSMGMGDKDSSTMMFYQRLNIIMDIICKRIKHRGKWVAEKTEDLDSLKYQVYQAKLKNNIPNFQPYLRGGVNDIMHDINDVMCKKFKNISDVQIELKDDRDGYNKIDVKIGEYSMGMMYGYPLTLWIHLEPNGPDAGYIRHSGNILVGFFVHKDYIEDFEKYINVK